MKPRHASTSNSWLAVIALPIVLGGCAAGLVRKPEPKCGGDPPMAMGLVLCSEERVFFDVGYDAGLAMRPTPASGSPFASLDAADAQLTNNMARSRRLRRDLAPYATREFRLDPCEGQDAGAVVIWLNGGGTFIVPGVQWAGQPTSVKDALSELEALSVKYYQASLFNPVETPER